MKLLFTWLLIAPSFLFAQTSSKEILPMEERYIFTAPVYQQVLSNATLKSNPTLQSNTLLLVPKGATVKLTARDRGFYRAFYNNKAGFIHFAFIDGDYNSFKAKNYPHVSSSNYISYEDEPDSIQLYAKVNIESPLKEKPDYQARTLSTIPAGTILKVTKHNSIYWQTEFTGTRGYLSTSYVAGVGESEKVAELNAKPKLETDDLTMIHEAVRKYSSPGTRIRSKMSTSYSASHYYIRGPRGGCYYLTGSGRKQYVDRSLCK